MTGASAVPAALESQRRLANWPDRWPVLPEPVLQSLRDIVELVVHRAGSDELEAAADHLIGILYSAGGDTLTSFCARQFLRDDTHPFIRCLDRGDTPGAPLRGLFERDLRRLEHLARTPWLDWVGQAGGDVPPPLTTQVACRERANDSGPWSAQMPREELVQQLCEPACWIDSVDELARFWSRFGCGPRQGVVAYRLGEANGGPGLLPIRDFAQFPLEWLQFSGPRTELLELNTLALLAGDGASNALIWGPRGCGKSTLIRSLVGRYWDQGLRAIEVPAAAYRHLPALLELVRHRPQRFIAVLDNIGIEPQDPSHRALATILDGGLEQTPANLVFYATSNYKDLVDRHGERPDGPPPQQADSARSLQMMGATEPALATYDPQGLQRLDERRALDDRFALKIFIDLPTKSQYEQIVLAYAARAGLADAEEELLMDFRVWCMRHNHDLVGGRTARDYIQHRVADSRQSTHRAVDRPQVREPGR